MNDDQETPKQEQEQMDLLTDDQLATAGLRRTVAYVRDPRAKKPTGNAARVKRHREKKAEQGIVQVNVEVPADEVDNVKELAVRLRQREEGASGEIKQPPEWVQKVEQILASGGWRAFLIRLLIKD